MLSSLVYVSLPNLLSTTDLDSAHDESELVKEPVLLLFFSLHFCTVMLLNFRISVDVMCRKINSYVLTKKVFFLFFFFKTIVLHWTNKWGHLLFFFICFLFSPTQIHTHTHTQSKQTYNLSNNNADLLVVLFVSDLVCPCAP